MKQLCPAHDNKLLYQKEMKLEKELCLQWLLMELSFKWMSSCKSNTKRSTQSYDNARMPIDCKMNAPWSQKLHFGRFYPPSDLSTLTTRHVARFRKNEAKVWHESQKIKVNTGICNRLSYGQEQEKWGRLHFFWTWPCGPLMSCSSSAWGSRGLINYIKNRVGWTRPL